jgi:hypothetical protein
MHGAIVKAVKARVPDENSLPAAAATEAGCR